MTVKYLMTRLSFNRNAYLYFLGYGLSTIGDWAALSGLTYLFYEKSTLYNLSLLQAVPIVISIIFVPLLGDFTDKHSAKFIIIFSNIALSILSFLFLYFSFSWYLICISIKSTILETSCLSQDKLFPLLIDKSELPRGMSALSLVRQSSSALGLSLGVYVASRVGTYVFLLDAITFFLFAVLVGFITKDSAHSRPISRQVSGENRIQLIIHRVLSLLNIKGIKKSAHYIWSNKSLIISLLLFSVCHLGWGMKDVVGVELIENQFNLNANQFGNYSALGVIAETVTALLILFGVIKIRKNSPIYIFLVPFFLGLSFALPIVRHDLWWAFLTKIFEGVMSLICGITFGYILIMDSPEEIRGSVSSFVLSSTLFFLVIGKILSGIMSESLTSETIFLYFGIFITLCSIILLVITRNLKNL